MPLLASQVLIVDDDVDVRDGLTWLLKSRDLTALAFDGYEGCRPVLQGLLETPTPLCMLLDLRMQGMSGLQAFHELVHSGVNLNRLPIIFLTGHGDIATAVETVKSGAFDFVEKPATDNRLVDQVQRAVNLSAAALMQQASASSREALLCSLSEREREVMLRVGRGQLNKVIAAELGVSMRTVEVHRSRVFEKLGVKSAEELAVYLSLGRTDA